MKASVRWLKELSGVDETPARIGELLTRAGLEVEGVHSFGRGLDRVVVAEVRGTRPHPTRDKLTLVTVFDGETESEIVCGAPNVPDPSLPSSRRRVVLAKVGAKLPNGMEIAPREVAGVQSSGMLCGETELGIGDDDAGILVLDEGSASKVGAPLASALKLEDDVLEIGITPNRPDCLGHVGLARELALLMGQGFSPPAAKAPYRLLATEGRPSAEGVLPVVDIEAAMPGETLNLVQPLAGLRMTVPVAIQAPERCSRYLGLTMHHVQVRPAPFWMRYRLFCLGQRAIDCVVDATNWILMETGHPVHAFDLEKLQGPAIVVRHARPSERFTTLDGIERTLDADDLVIADQQNPVALAGIMGGAESGVSSATRAVLLEAAYFDPRSVRRSSRRHGLHTEASHRFERGCDPGALPWVLRRAAALLGAAADAAVAPLSSDAIARRVQAFSIPLRPKHVDELLGMPVAEAETRRVLEGIGCSISPGENGDWRVAAPTHRPDLTRPEDLIEEVARVRGYDEIPSELASARPRAVGDGRVALIRALRQALVGAGLSEALNYSFLSLAELTKAHASLDVVHIANPLTEERAVMRTSLLPGLVSDVVRAQRHQAPRAMLFELGRTYHPGAEGERPVERRALAAILCGPRRVALGDEAPFDFYDLKGVVERAIGALGLRVETLRDGEPMPPFVHPGRSARIVVEGKTLGVLGELHPDVRDAFEILGAPQYLELDAEALLALALQAPLPQAHALPRVPAVTRDLAVVVEEATTSADVSGAIREAGAKVETVEVFDVYRGEPVPAGKKSLAFRIAYRDADKTLTDKLVDEMHARVVSAVGERFGASLRT